MSIGRTNLPETGGDGRRPPVTAMTSTRVLLSASPVSLALALSGLVRTATVEAEFGSELVSGTVATLAHHGERSGNLCPCLEENRDIDLDAIGVSHIDLDTLGGIAALLGRKPEAPNFWQLAAFVDVFGPHRLIEWCRAQDVDQLNAFWAFSEGAKVFAPRDGSVLDVTAQINIFLNVIEKIIVGDSALIEAGREFARKGEALARESLIETVEANFPVLLRSSTQFVNHLYSPNGGAVVAYNSKFKSITVSFANGEGNACEFVQGLWGELAGGHKGIAGSPRGQEMTMDDAREAFDVLCGANGAMAQCQSCGAVVPYAAIDGRGCENPGCTY